MSIFMAGFLSTFQRSGEKRVRLVLGKNFEKFEKMEGTGCSLSQIDRPWHKMRKGTVIKRSEFRAFDLAAKIE